MRKKTPKGVITLNTITIEFWTNPATKNNEIRPPGNYILTKSSLVKVKFINSTLNENVLLIMFSLGHETGVYQHESKQVHHWIPGATKDGDGAEIHSKTLLPTTSQTVSFGIPNYIDTTDTKNGYGYGIIAIENPGSMAAARSRGAVRILSVVDPSVVIKN